MVWGVHSSEIVESTNFYVQQTYLHNRSIEEGTEDLPYELGAWKRIGDVFTILSTDSGKSVISQLYSCLERLTFSLEKQAGV